MEFSSSYISVLDAVVADRGQLLAFFTFGVMGAAFVVFLIMALLKRIGTHQFIVNSFLLLGSTLLISLFVGMITLMPLSFMGISGLKMVLIWIIMFLMIMSFLIYQFKVIDAKIKKGMNSSK